MNQHQETVTAQRERGAANWRFCAETHPPSAEPGETSMRWTFWDQVGTADPSLARYQEPVAFSSETATADPAESPGDDSHRRALADVRREFSAARDEVFEDGMENRFAAQLVLLIERHGEYAIQAVGRIIAEGKEDPEIRSEALRTLGRLEDSRTHIERRLLLERFLVDSSHWIRDGAVLGLSFMGDPVSASRLREAIEAEPWSALRSSMQRVLHYLEQRG